MTGHAVRMHHERIPEKRLNGHNYKKLRKAKVAKNCGVTAAKNGTYVEQSWKIVLKDAVSLAAVFLFFGCHAKLPPT